MMTNKIPFYDPKLKKISRTLRKNMTNAEILLWSRLKGKKIKGTQFLRQKPIGNYIVDFYCPERKLVIEVDGSQHFRPEGLEKDTMRTAELESYGLKVIRFSDKEVFSDVDSVCQAIYNAL